MKSTTGGKVGRLHVRDGDDVSQGQLLATIENWELKAKIAGVRDELRIAQADVQSELAESKWRAFLRGSEHHEAVTEYYQAYGALAEQDSRIADLEQKLRRLRLVYAEGAVSEAEVETVRIDLADAASGLTFETIAEAEAVTS